jgi:hypothetical protein
MENDNLQKVNFISFVLSLAGAIQIHLGIIPNPQTGKTEKNLQLAKETIDLLDVLKEKTKGNLTKDEEDLFDHMLFECRMKYIEENKKINP